MACVREGVVGSLIDPTGWLHPPVSRNGPYHGPPTNPPEGSQMKWTKPEAEVVAVTMEVTAYVATL